MLSDGTGTSQQEQTRFCDHTSAVLRLIERVYIEDRPPSIVVALSAMEKYVSLIHHLRGAFLYKHSSLQALAMTPLDPEHEDLSERLRPSYEKLFAVVRELQVRRQIKLPGWVLTKH